MTFFNNEFFDYEGQLAYFLDQSMHIGDYMIYQIRVPHILS